MFKKAIEYFKIKILKDPEYKFKEKFEENKDSIS
jgi:hypothetical protein